MSFARRRGRARSLLASLLVCAAGFGVLSGPSLAQISPMPTPAPHPTPVPTSQSTPASASPLKPASAPGSTPAPAPHPTPSFPEPPQSSAGPPSEKPWPPYVPQQYVFPAQLPPPPGDAIKLPGPPGSDPLSWCPYCEDHPGGDAPTEADQAREIQEFRQTIEGVLNEY